MHEHDPIAILYVEDEDSARELLLSTLRRSFPRLRFFSAANGRDGLALFRRHNPRIVLTDIRMPKMSGIEMSVAIRQIAPETIIIATSAYSDPDFLLKAIEIGINYFVTKPLEVERLVAVISRAIDTIRLEQQVLSQAEHIKKLSRAVEQSPSTVVITDRDGNIEYVNPKFSQLTGYTAAEALGQNPRILKSGLMDPAIFTDLWQTITAGREWRGEMLNRKKNGDFYWEFASISPLFGASGEITSYIAVKEDISLRKQAELEIRELNRVLAARAAELEAVNSELEAFNYTVSHDLRTPITVIGGFSQLLQKKPVVAADAEALAYLQTIGRAVEKMEELINSLLELSRLSNQQLDSGHVDLSRLATLASLELKVATPERAVEFRIADGISCDGDQGLLRIVLDNLIGNAWKYSSRRDVARIEFGIEELDGARVCFVRDNGAGFDSPAADKLFTCFTRLHDKEEFPGLGIGLATVQRIINRHGGTIRAEGAVDQGATFYFTLPALAQAEQSATEVQRHRDSRYASLRAISS